MPPFQPRAGVWLRGVLLMFVALAIVPLDVTISRWCFLGAAGQPRLLREVLDNCATFGHVVSVFVVASAVCCLDHSRRRAWLDVLKSGLGAGLLAAGMKLIVTRTRPRGFDFSSDDVIATFQGALPVWSDHAGSFPSAHTATAVSMAVILSSLYPRGRVLFWMLAGLVGVQRLHAGAHFPSDVVFGAAIGWIIGLLCVTRCLSARFARLWRRS